MDGTALKFAAANWKVEFVPLEQNARLGRTTVRLIVQTGREGLHWLLWLHRAIAMHISHIMCGAQQMIGIDQTVTAISNAVRASCLMMEVSSLADIIAISIGVFSMSLRYFIVVVDKVRLFFFFCFCIFGFLEWGFLVER